jgi:hypothetical protein
VKPDRGLKLIGAWRIFFAIGRFAPQPRIGRRGNAEGSRAGAASVPDDARREVGYYELLKKQMAANRISSAPPRAGLEVRRPVGSMPRSQVIGAQGPPLSSPLA